MYAKTTPQSGTSYLHMWDISNMKVFDGGFALDKTTIPSALTVLPKGVYLKGDFTARTAKVIKTAVLQAAVLSTDTVVKFVKNSLLVSTDILGIGGKAVTLGTIDTSNASYDSITITANALGALSVGAVLQTCDAAGSSANAVNPDGLLPFQVEIDTLPSVSIMFRADGVVTSRLPLAPTSAIKAALPNLQFLNQ